MCEAGRYSFWVKRRIGLGKLLRPHCSPPTGTLSLIRDIIPKWLEFTLVKYYNLLRLMFPDTSIHYSISRMRTKVLEDLATSGIIWPFLG